MKTVAAVLLCAAAVPAWADASSFAVLSGLHYDLVDLRPDDGIAPSAKAILPGPGSSFVSASYFIQRLDVSEEQERRVATLFGSASVALSHPLVSVSGGINWSGGALDLSLRGHSAVGAPHAGVYNGDIWEFNHGLQVELSPYTAIQWHGRYEVEAQLHGDLDGITRAYTNADIVIETSTGYWFYGAQADIGLGDNGLFQREAGIVDFSLVNDSASTAVKGAAIYLSMFGDPGLLPAVPEPSVASLMLCGLALTGMVARQRKRSV